MAVNKKSKRSANAVNFTSWWLRIMVFGNLTYSEIQFCSLVVLQLTSNCGNQKPSNMEACYEYVTFMVSTIYTELQVTSRQLWFHGGQLRTIIEKCLVRPYKYLSATNTSSLKQLMFASDVFTCISPTPQPIAKLHVGGDCTRSKGYCPPLSCTVHYVS